MHTKLIVPPLSQPSRMQTVLAEVAERLGMQGLNMNVGKTEVVVSSLDRREVKIVDSGIIKLDKFAGTLGDREGSEKAVQQEWMQCEKV